MLVWFQSVWRAGLKDVAGYVAFSRDELPSIHSLVWVVLYVQCMYVTAHADLSMHLFGSGSKGVISLFHQSKIVLRTGSKKKAIDRGRRWSFVFPVDLWLPVCHSIEQMASVQTRYYTLT